MEYVILTIGVVLSVAGIIGCFVPAIPGPPLNYIALTVLKLYDGSSFSTTFLVITALATIVVTALDYFLPIWGGKIYGVSKYGIWGSVLGMIVGFFFFPPFGMIFGLFLGAVIGEIFFGKEFSEAFKSGWATFLLSLLAILIKLSVSIVFTFYFVSYFF
ncbi:MAG: DUF456 domain-containing protein [Chlorobi bacterium]|nr:DUF456 domain-containing protein [Chlorobiota bacterium]